MGGYEHEVVNQVYSSRRQQDGVIRAVVGETTAALATCLSRRQSLGGLASEKIIPLPTANLFKWSATCMRRGNEKSGGRKSKSVRCGTFQASFHMSASRREVGGSQREGETCRTKYVLIEGR